MKKVKIMLMAVLVLAVVGGALAFKTKFGDLEYCTAPATTIAGQWFCTSEANPNGYCPQYENDITLVGDNTTIVCTTETVNDPVNPCPDNRQCDTTLELQTIEN